MPNSDRRLGRGGLLFVLSVDAAVQALQILSLTRTSLGLKRLETLLLLH